MTDPLMQFQQAAAARGLLIDHVEGDGRIHRCAVEGDKRGRASGSYVFHANGIAAGGFQNFRDGFGWQNWHASADRVFTPDERRHARERANAMRLQRDADEADRHTQAAARARRLWELAKPAGGDHPYLVAKGVRAYGLRQLRAQLVVPLRDVDGCLMTLQFIGPDGAKRFLTGGRKAGCYLAIGRPERVIVVCEGYATAASIFEATGHATAAAFDCGNLLAVGRALRAKFPSCILVFAADNDMATPGNPGLTKATEAARAVGGQVAVPRLHELCRPEATSQRRAY